MTSAISSLYKILPWISGFIVAIGLMVFGDVLRLARYCGPDCLYEIPYLGAYSQDGAQIFGWLLIVGGFSIMLGLNIRPRARSQKPI